MVFDIKKDSILKKCFQMAQSRIGATSLVIAASGFLLLEVARYMGWIYGAPWDIFTSGFEAAVIGAIADWFAVSALFYEIPIPLVRRHTNIIVKNRAKLTEGIVDMVTNKWLSPDSIQEKLRGVNLGQRLAEELQKEETLTRLLDVLRKIILSLTDQLDNPKLAIWLQHALKNQMEKIALERPLGEWIEQTVIAGRHHEAMNVLLSELRSSIQNPSTRAVIYTKLKIALDEYKKQDWIKGTTVWLGTKTGGIDVDLLADKLINIAMILADEVGNNSDHPLRLKLDEAAVAFARNLQNDEPTTQGFMRDLKRNLVLNQGTLSLIRDGISSLKAGIEQHLDHSETQLMRFITEKVRGFVAELTQEKESIAAMDDWLKASLSKLINTYHPEIGNIVRESLEKLDNQGLMEQIKDKVGNDLQYIRLNGAVVGGLVGLVIAVLRWAWF